MKEPISKIIFMIPIGDIECLDVSSDIFHNYSKSDILVCAKNIEDEYVYFVMTNATIKTKYIEDNKGEINISSGINFRNDNINKLGEKITEYLKSVTLDGEIRKCN